MHEWTYEPLRICDDIVDDGAAVRVVAGGARASEEPVIDPLAYDYKGKLDVLYSSRLEAGDDLLDLRIAHVRNLTVTNSIPK